MNSIDGVLENLKHLKGQTPLVVPLNMVFGTKEELLGSVTNYKPGNDKRNVEVMLATIPAFSATWACMVCECWVRHIDADPSVPISEDPSAETALLVVKGDAGEEFEWRLAPYGLSDEGVVTWKESTAVTTPILDAIRGGMTSAFQQPAAPEMKQALLTLLYANQYSIVLTRGAVE